MVAPALAQVPLGNYWGRQVVWHNARDLAFDGLSRFAPGPAAVFDNPAQLGFVRRPGLELTYGLDLSSEQRTRVVYDQFENTVGEAVFADNAGGAGIPGPLAFAYPFAGRFAVGAGIAPALDFQYQYHKEYRDDFYALIGEDRVEQTGTVFEAGAGAGLKVLNWLSVGASGGYLFGTRDLEVWTIRTPDTSYEHESGSPSGITYSGSIAARPFDRLNMELGFTGPVTLANWKPRGAWDDGGERYPLKVRMNVAYQAPGTLPSRVMLGAEYQAKCQVDTGGEPNFGTESANVLSIRAGVEHTMLNFVKLRYGFGVEPSAFDPTVQLVGVGAGVGLDAGPFLVDVGAMFRREVIGASLFRGQLSPDDQRIYETGAVLAVTLSKEF